MLVFFLQRVPHPVLALLGGKGGGRGTHTFLTSWAKSPHSLGGSLRSGLVQESSAELWLTMRVTPTVDKTPQGQSRHRELFARQRAPQSLAVPM